MRAAAHSAAAAAISCRTGSAAAGRPIDITRSPAASSRSTMPMGAHSTTSWRDAMPHCSSCARIVASSSPPTAANATMTRLRVATVSAVTLWCETPRWRSRGSANDDTQARNRGAREAGRGVEHRADLDAGEPEASGGADDAGAHHDDDRVRLHNPARDGERAVHRDGLVVASERVTARDRRIERGHWRAIARRDPRARAASAAPSVIT